MCVALSTCLVFSKGSMGRAEMQTRLAFGYGQDWLVVSEQNKQDALKDEDGNGIADVDELDATRCVVGCDCWATRDACMGAAVHHTHTSPPSSTYQPRIHQSNRYFLRKVNLVLVSVNPETLSEAFKCVSYLW